MNPYQFAYAAAVLGRDLDLTILVCQTCFDPIDGPANQETNIYAQIHEEVQLIMPELERKVLHFEGNAS